MSLQPLKIFFSAIENTLVRFFWLRVMIVYVFFGCLFSFYFFLSNFTATDDQFFNIRLAQKLSEEGLGVLTQFDQFAFSHNHPWVFNTFFYYFLIPFTWIEPLEVGIKAFAVTSVAFTGTVIYVFLSTFRFEKAFLWTLTLLALCFSVEDFGHLFMARAFVLTPALLVLLLITLKKKWFFLTGSIAFLYFFLHSATAFFPLLVVVVYALFQAQKNKQEALWSVGSVLMGLGLACLVGIFSLPGFIDAFRNFFVTLTEIVWSFQSSGSNVKIDEGLESYPLSLFDILLQRPLFGLGLIVFLTVGSFRMLRSIRNGEATEPPMYLTLLFLSGLFIVGTFFTKRAFDFLLVFGILFIAFSLRESIAGLQVKDKKIYIVGLVVAVTIAWSAHILTLADRISSVSYYAHIEGAALYIRNHSERGSIVFNPTINFFPTFYFYNEGYNRVIIGIEPRDMYNNDARKYWLWYNLSNFGVICYEEDCNKKEALRDAMIRDHSEEWYRDTGKEAAQVFRDEFHTTMILVRGDFSFLQDLLSKSNSFEKVYESPVTKIFSVYRVR